MRAGDGGGSLLRLGQARVLDFGFFGTYHQCTATLEADDKPFKVRLPQKEGLVTGAGLSLRLDPADLVLLTR